MKHILLFFVALISAVVCVAAEFPSAPPSADTRQVELAQLIPGFGGYFFKGAVPHVNLISTAGQAAARDVLGPNVEIHAAQYLFTDLLMFRDQLRTVLVLPKIVFLDADEGQNRVVIAVDRSASASELAAFETAIAISRVPRPAVVLQPTDPVQLAQSLSDTNSPMAAGVKIDSDAGQSCTAGFNVTYEAGQGFITCSHCTAVQGGVEGTSYAQGTRWVGVEDRDPDWLSGGACPSGNLCRYSDSALIRYAFVGENGGGGTIARTTYVDTCNGSTTIDGSSPVFNVSTYAQYPSQGQILNKIGFKTGWTAGEVLNTAVDTPEPGTSDKFLFAQDFIHLNADHGDSGSPVFYWDGDNSHGVVLFGILWGTTNANGCAQAMMSHTSSIQYEIGPFTINTVP